jgi:hypothetical protein
MDTDRMTANALGVGAIVAALMLAAPAQAEVRIGGVGEMNMALYSTQRGDSGMVMGRLARWGGGGMLEVDLTRNLALTVRPGWTGKGTDIQGTPELGDVAQWGNPAYIHIMSTYVELPLFLKYTALQEGVRPYVLAGPSVGLLQSATREWTISNQAVQTQDIKDWLKSTDFSLCIGAGVGRNLGPAHVFIEGVYAFGLADINEEEAADVNKTRDLRFRFGVALRLGGH